MFDHVYDEPSPVVEEQRAQFAQYLSTFAEGGQHA
jgi:hypothetical protein